MIRVTLWMMLGLAASAGFQSLCEHLRLPASAELLSALGWYISLFAFMAWLACRAFGTSWVDLVPLRPVSTRLIAPVLLITIGVFIVDLVFIRIFSQIFQHLPDDDVGMLQYMPLSVRFITLSLLPAIFEEAASRGIVLQTLLGADMSKRRAIVYSAAIFAAAHCSVIKFPGCFVLGVLTAWMFVRTGSLLPGMLLHAANNAIAVFLTQPGPLPPPISNGLELGASAVFLLVAPLAGAALVVMGVVAFRRILAYQVISPAAREAIRDVLERAA